MLSPLETFDVVYDSRSTQQIGISLFIQGKARKRSV